jgi:TPR repeat protein
MKPIRYALIFAAASALACFGVGASAQSGEMIVDISAPPTATPLTVQQAADRFREGTLLEHRKDLRGALMAYTEAGEAGHGMAQKKLGDIYSNGNAVVERDYETALKWYERAREQGIEIPKPLVYPGDPNQVIRLK